eukprot:908921-Heterocapsa_arctica.AAC.1
MDEYLKMASQLGASCPPNSSGGASEPIVSESAKADLRRQARGLAEDAKRRRLRAKTVASEGQQP